jgi:DNA-binding NtrC family response regulator
VKPCFTVTWYRGNHITAIHVTVVEDEAPLRELIATTLERSGRFLVDAPDVDGWRETVTQTQPQVLLLDLFLEGQDALEELPQVLVASPHTMVAVLTAMAAEEQESRSLAAGAFVFYEKATIAQLPEMIAEDHASFERALAGEDVMAPSALVRRPPPSEDVSVAAG